MNRRIDFYQEHNALTTQTDTQAANGVSLPLDLTVQNVTTKLARDHYATPDLSAESYHNAPYEVLSRDALEETIHREMTQGELFYTEDEKISLCLEYTSRLEYSLGNTQIKYNSWETPDKLVYGKEGVGNLAQNIVGIC